MVIIKREEWDQYIGSMQWYKDIEDGKTLPTDSEQIRLYGKIAFEWGKVYGMIDLMAKRDSWLTKEYMQEHHIDGETPMSKIIPVPNKSAMAWLADAAPKLALRLPDLVANRLVEIDPNKPDILNFDATVKMIAYIFKAYVGYSCWKEVSLHVLSRGKEIKAETLKRSVPQEITIKKKPFYYPPTGRKASAWPLWAKILKIN